MADTPATDPDGLEAVLAAVLAGDPAAAVRLVDQPEGHYAVLIAGGAPLEARFPRTWAAQKKRPMFT